MAKKAPEKKITRLPDELGQFVHSAIQGMSKSELQLFRRDSEEIMGSSRRRAAESNERQFASGRPL
jgi:hypothetical protein